MVEPVLVILTVYMKLDLAEAARLLQLLMRQPMRIERFNVHLAASDTRQVKGLESVSEPIMRAVVAGTVSCHGDLERVTKALNRLVRVYKVLAVSA